MPPEGTSDNIATGPEPTSSGNVTSGTASEAMIKAAMSVSSTDTAPANAGDTQAQPNVSDVGATADATAQPGTEGQAAAAAATRSQDAPESRIQAAVKNAREKATQEVEARYAPFKDLDPEDVTTSMDILADLRRDPADFVRRLSAELQQSGRQPAQPQVEEVDEAYPEADLVSPDGRLKTYSVDAFKKAVAIEANKLRRELTGQMKPLLDRQKTEAEQQEQADRRAATSRLVASTLSEARKLPHFTKENEPKIIEKMRAMDPRVKKAIGPVAAMYVAYNQFLGESVFPGIETTAAKKVSDDNLRKAATSNGQAHPVDQGAGSGKKPQLNNVSDLAKHMEHLANSAS